MEETSDFLTSVENGLALFMNVTQRGTFLISRCSRRILKSERRRSTNPATTGCPKAARNCRRAWPSARMAVPFDRATRRSRVGTAEANARGVFLLVLVHMLLHANPGFKTRFECKGRCKSTADAELHHPHTSTPTHAFCLPPAADCRVGRQLSSELTFAFRL